ncbi:MAG TPA: DUF2087 domain-containing protein [Propionibacteriaceae bacterium]|nr:DUF2087 domain-containing protein [Propionibacteriaceae bacterium]
MDAEPLDWRAVLAMLANRDTRAVLADVLASPIDGPARTKALANLLGSGLLELDADGNPVLAESRLRATLKVDSPVIGRGIERFLTPSGRISAYPSRSGEREELLRLIATRSLAADEELTEVELGVRLGTFTDDVSTLRRYLIDHGILTRRSDGTGYRLAS